MKFPAMFSPVQIGSVTVPNRFVVPPMGNNLANTGGSLSGRSLSYYEARAKGGFGLITIESTVVYEQAKGGPRKPCLFSDSTVESFRRILTHTELKAFTPHTLTTPEQFAPELTRIREQGYAVENGEYKIGLRSVFAPIHDVTGEVHYAIGCVGMFRQVQSDEFLRAIRLVCAAAETISHAIGYHG